MDWVPLKIHKLKSQPPPTPVPQHVTVFGDGAFKVVNKLKRDPQGPNSIRLAYSWERQRDQECAYTERCVPSFPPSFHLYYWSHVLDDTLFSSYIFSKIQNLHVAPRIIF